MKIIFFFFEFGKLEFFKGIENFGIFFFLKKFGNLEFFKELKILIDDFFFFLKNLEILNVFKELKILIDFFFFEKFGNFKFFQGIENFD